MAILNFSRFILRECLAPLRISALGLGSDEPTKPIGYSRPLPVADHGQLRGIPVSRSAPRVTRRPPQAGDREGNCNSLTA